MSNLDRSENKSRNLLLFEDDHLLVIHKPAGISTHAADPYGSEGIYDWLRHREARWASLAIIHRLDKDTSGVLVFAKTNLACRSLTAQFTNHRIEKRYLFRTDRAISWDTRAIRSTLIRNGARYESTESAEGVKAETRFRVLDRSSPNRMLVEARPLTGRTHQIRVHAAEHGLPILGDRLYGGTEFPRLCLHAVELTFRHPETNEPVTFTTEAGFDLDPRASLRQLLFAEEATNSYRAMHGASEGRPGWYLDRLNDRLLVTTDKNPMASITEKNELENWSRHFNCRAVYHRPLTRISGKSGATGASATRIIGADCPDEFEILENGLRYVLSLKEGASFGLFLDQKDNRRRLLHRHVAANLMPFPEDGRPEVLNTFAYTCGFSLCAAKAGARTTSIDLSKNYLEWGKRNFSLNGLDLQQHDFIYGDVFDWGKRLAKKNRQFDLIILDPPTFSRSKESGTFRVESDYGRLVKAVLPLLKKTGVLFASTNAATIKPEEFLKVLQGAIHSCQRIIRQTHFFPQPPDFPISREEPGYLKTFWLRLS